MLEKKCWMMIQTWFLETFVQSGTALPYTRNLAMPPSVVNKVSLISLHTDMNLIYDSENCGPPCGNKFDPEVGQRSRHGANWKGLSKGLCMPNINALLSILQKIRTRLSTCKVDPTLQQIWSWCRSKVKVTTWCQWKGLSHWRTMHAKHQCSIINTYSNPRWKF